VIFTYILGYKVDTGHMEAVNLISSNKYSEKQIVSFGRFSYLDRISVQRVEVSLNPHPATLLLHENSDIIRLVINSIRKDLEDRDEINNCLALHAIANIGGKEMAESLAEDVHRLLISA